MTMSTICSSADTRLLYAFLAFLASFPKLVARKHGEALLSSSTTSRHVSGSVGGSAAAASASAAASKRDRFDWRQSSPPFSFLLRSCCSSRDCCSSHGCSSRAPCSLMSAVCRLIGPAQHSLARAQLLALREAAHLRNCPLARAPLSLAHE